MLFLDNVWSSATYVLSILTLSPFQGPTTQDQTPLVAGGGGIQKDNGGPIFKPPGRGRTGRDADFVCDYSQMKGWEACSSPDNRGCWLRNTKSGAEFNISTNYEDIKQTPIGINREYVLEVTDSWINADGMNFTEAKIFNGSYPGPWLQACWGDNVTVTVHNHMKTNGTSVHWHGIRQWLTAQMDGVNGVTQCPIAPGDSFTYKFRAMQYGSTWYHSHYSVQYADGVAGPLTLHGPASANYDEAKPPTLMSDWGHNSAFNAIYGKLQAPSILLNGTGNVTRYINNNTATLRVPDPYKITFQRPQSKGGRAKRYLLRLINTSFENTFVFSIDNHTLQIVGADFVPISPYQNTSVLVGIGQRYNVIVTATDPLGEGGNYWIRTYRADCFLFPHGSPGYETTGIVSYGQSNALPTTSAWNNIDLTCADELYSGLHPIVPWTVGQPKNDLLGGVGENFTVQANPQSSIFPLALFSVAPDAEGFTPLQVDYNDPTFLRLNYTGKWDPKLVIVPESYTSNDWVWLAIKGFNGNTALQHPIHLHGHDFAILQQIANTTFPDKLNLKLDNPPRRDVVLLPDNGYIVIAFKTDNPGPWLLHCHIAYHASFGLAMQILERQKNAAELWPSVKTSPALRNAQTTCNTWNKWFGDCKNWWPGDGSSCLGGINEFEPDSGI